MAEDSISFPDFNARWNRMLLTIFGLWGAQSSCPNGRGRPFKLKLFSSGSTFVGDQEGKQIGSCLKAS